MQVEVSKHTEGLREKVVRPNGLPSSLIRYDGAFNSNSPLFFLFFFLFGIPSG